MSGKERYLDQAEAEALNRLRSLPPGLAVVGPWLEVLFPAANTTRDVRHGLAHHGVGVIPTGYEVIAQEGGHVRADALSTWTPEIATLKSDAANVRVRLRFILTLEDPTDA